MTTAAAPPPHAPGTPEHALAVALAAEAAAPDLITRAEAAAAVHAARTALVLQWRKLQWKMARRAWAKNTNRGPLDDYFAWVRVGWWEAALRFKPELGWKFQTYAMSYCRKYLNPHACREAAGGVHVPQHLGIVHVPVTAFGGVESEDGGPFAGSIPDQRAEERKPDPAGVWAAVCAALPDARERQVVWMRYGLGASLEEVGKAVGGISRERVRQISAKAVERLRKHEAAFAEWREDAA